MVAFRQNKELVLLRVPYGSDGSLPSSFAELFIFRERQHSPSWLPFQLFNIFHHRIHHVFLITVFHDTGEPRITMIDGLTSHRWVYTSTVAKIFMIINVTEKAWSFSYNICCNVHSSHLLYSLSLQLTSR